MRHSDGLIRYISNTGYVGSNVMKQTVGVKCIYSALVVGIILKLIYLRIVVFLLRVGPSNLPLSTHSLRYLLQFSSSDT